MRGEKIDPYDLITESAANSPVGANGILVIPHFMGAGAPHWNPDARGVFFGLALGHTNADLYRAVLEGVSFEIKKNINVFASLGVIPEEMRVTGGDP